MLRYANHLGTYEGETPRDVLQVLHGEALKGWQCSLEEWKEWNRDLWKAQVNLDLPTGNDPISEGLFLDGLVRAGVLERREHVGR
ncbi:MAG: hypothetical protein PW734_07410 [Verrucomicrobium sp.]|nr:hypothetical protein [Verrucomicrobium sp.]